ncbi:hypothetical protein [Eikenella corrodens]|uniref:hypothetical protein n=1 Tax=Eikenella corrodens TaxID=539 RepID=UPI00129A445C|nr:hypothetical protein [Eikenella corrodens]
MFVSDNLKKIFEENNGQDLLYIILRYMENNGHASNKFIQMLNLSSNGYGIFISEYMGFSLDMDWDYPDQFDKVFFFMGDMNGNESSSIPFDTYIELIKALSISYIMENPTKKEEINFYLNKIINRYARFIDKSNST